MSRRQRHQVFVVVVGQKSWKVVVTNSLFNASFSLLGNICNVECSYLALVFWRDVVNVGGFAKVNVF